jgi:signal transduction histidine kinase
MKRTDETKRTRATKLTTAKRQLRRETARRKAAEEELKESKEHYGQLLAQSRLMEEQLRQLSRRVLLAQEEERKHISRELHDAISQILTGINVRLATLKIEAMATTGSIRRKIAHTQRLVEKSVAAVHRFARVLRPAMLDDLGLVPALLSLVKEFGKRTGIRTDFLSTTREQLKPLDSLKRTTLYRIAQEALTNTQKHARASSATVSVEVYEGIVHLSVSDDGIAFDVERVLGSKRRKGLGIIGMRERAEMVGGTFAIESVPDRGTTVRVRVPLGQGTVPAAEAVPGRLASPADSPARAPANAAVSRRRVKSTIGEKP